MSIASRVLGRNVRALPSLTIAAGLFASAPFGLSAAAQESADDVLHLKTEQALKGKTVAFVPIAMSFDFPQAYDLAMKQHAAKWGYKYVVRDPNFSVEQAVQAIEQLIAEKPDVIVAFPYDANAFNRLVKKANDAGILWITVNQTAPTAAVGDAFVGYDPYEYGQTLAKAAGRLCGAGTSGKVALVQTPPNNASTVSETKGVQEEIAKHPNLSLVSVQSAVGDANKAHAIASTVLKQHPDLCAFMGQWDGQDVGIPSAIEEAGLKGKVAVVTLGAAFKPNACAKLEDGSYSAYVTIDAAKEVTKITDTISQLLQAKPTPGKSPYLLLDEPQILTKDNINDASCWTLETLKRSSN
jgi:ribose transport system substrate-binding protein